MSRGRKEPTQELQTLRIVIAIFLGFFAIAFSIKTVIAIVSPVEGHPNNWPYYSALSFGMYLGVGKIVSLVLRDRDKV